MKTDKIILLIIILIFSKIIGQTTLMYPIGARSMAMGGTGYVIANDATTLFFNPAILGISNIKWKGGESQFYLEPPIDGVNKSCYSFAWQCKKFDKIGFATYLDKIDGGFDVLEGENGNIIDKSNYYESTVAAGAGYCFSNNSFLSNSIGISAKYYGSSVSTVKSGEMYHSFAFSLDAGYILKLINVLGIGIVVKNIGTNINFKIKDSTLSKVPQQPLIAAGIGYTDNFDYGKLKVLSISSEMSFWNLFGGSLYTKEINILTGIELDLLNTIPVRAGFSRSIIDNSESINKISIGTGISLFNHFYFDIFYAFFYKYSIPNYGFSIAITRMLNWNRNDKRWWIKY